MRPLAVVAAVALAAGAARAEELGPVEIHGFVSQGYIVTSDNNYLARTADGGSFEFAEAGLNATKALRDDLRVGIQLFARDLGPVGNYNAKLDWFYLDYRWKDWLGIRAGRVKLPFGLYNDSSDVDAGHVPVLLPQSVYPIENRDLLLALTGGEVYGYLDLDSAGALSYALYGGTIFVQISTSGLRFAVDELTVPYLVGGRLLWDTPVDGLRVAASVQALRLDGYLTAEMPFKVELPALLWVASVEYALRDLLLTAEYSRWHVEVESTNPVAVPSSSSTSERAYAMASYRLNTRFQPGVYYSMYYPDVDHRQGRENMQHDLAATLRVDLFPGWLLKLEGHFIHGTAALSPALNGGATPADLVRDWGAFLVKTTAYF